MTSRYVPAHFKLVYDTLHDCITIPSLSLLQDGVIGSTPDTRTDANLINEQEATTRSTKFVDLTSKPSGLVIVLTKFATSFVFKLFRRLFELRSCLCCIAIRDNAAKLDRPHEIMCRLGAPRALCKPYYIP